MKNYTSTMYEWDKEKIIAFQEFLKSEGLELTNFYCNNIVFEVRGGKDGESTLRRFTRQYNQRK